MPNNRDDAIDMPNCLPHVEATLIWLLHEEVKKGNMQTSTLKKNNGLNLKQSCMVYWGSGTLLSNCKVSLIV